jgi:ketosteroid isomerase-like protein
VILWQELTFWTAVGQLGIGALVGLTIGVIVRRARRRARPGLAPAEGRICPACGAPSLRRVRRSSTQRLLRVFTRQRPYVCLRCEWPSAPPTASRRRSLSRRTPDSSPQTILDTKSIVARATERVTPNDDMAEVKDVVFRSLALLNASDVAARPTCYLSEATSFGVDGRRLTSDAFDRRRPASNTQTYDLRCRDLRVYFHKDTAIATGYLAGTLESSNGAAARVTGRSSWVLLRQNGEWKLAHNHVSPLNPDS